MQYMKCMKFKEDKKGSRVQSCAVEKIEKKIAKHGLGFTAFDNY